MNRNLASTRNVASANRSRASRQHRYNGVAYIIMRFCHFCGMHSFVSGPLLQICRFTAGKQNCPAGSAPVPAEALRTPATATSRGASRRRRRFVRLFRRCSPRYRRLPLPRPACSSALLLWKSSSPLPSPHWQVAPAAATPVSALQASKFYSGEAAESIANNAQRCDMENETVPLQGKTRLTMGVSRSNTHANLQDSESKECP